MGWPGLAGAADLDQGLAELEAPPPYYATYHMSIKEKLNVRMDGCDVEPRKSVISPSLLSPPPLCASSVDTPPPSSLSPPPTESVCSVVPPASVPVAPSLRASAGRTLALPGSFRLRGGREEGRDDWNGWSGGCRLGWGRDGGGSFSCGGEEQWCPGP